MLLRLRRLDVLVLALSLLSSSLASADAEFYALGDLPGGVFSSIAFAVSGDGSTVVGRSESADGSEAFRWTLAEGIVGLGDLADGDFSSTARAVSFDGSTIVGGGASAAGDEAFRWTSAGGMVGLGDLPGGSFYSVARDVSADGQVIVGDSWDAIGERIFRWTSAMGLEAIETPEAPQGLTGTGISGDGSTIVGYWWISFGGLFNAGAFRWTEAGGSETVIGLDDYTDHEVFGISADGTAIIGGSIPFCGFFCVGSPSPFLRRDGEPVFWLGSSPDFLAVRALGLSADGRIVVGYNNPESGLDAIIWDDVNRPRLLQTVLSQQGVDLTGWRLRAAYGVSDDGRVVVGSALNPSGQVEAFLAILEEPPATPVPSLTIWGALVLVVVMAVAAIVGPLRIHRAQFS